MTLSAPTNSPGLVLAEFLNFLPLAILFSACALSSTDLVFITFTCSRPTMHTMFITCLGHWYRVWTILLWVLVLILSPLYFGLGRLAAKNQIQQNLTDHHYVNCYTNNASVGLRFLIGLAFLQLINYSQILYTWRWANAQLSVASFILHILHGLVSSRLISLHQSIWATTLKQNVINCKRCLAVAIIECTLLIVAAFIITSCIMAMVINVLLCHFLVSDLSSPPPMVTTG